MVKHLVIPLNTINLLGGWVVHVIILGGIVTRVMRLQG